MILLRKIIRADESPKDEDQQSSQMDKATVAVEVLRTPQKPLDRKAVDRATRECNKLLDLIKKNKIAEIYKNEYNKNLFKFDRIRYLSIYKHG
jgi:hypothetical protein